MPATETASQVVCWMPFAGPAGTVTRGERLPADSPLVTRGRLYFVDANLPERDWPYCRRPARRGERSASA